MAITSEKPLGLVSRGRFYDEMTHLLPPDILCAGEDYDVRLVTSPLGNRFYAADFLVKICGIRYPRRGLSFNKLSLPFLRVEMAYISEDGKISEETETRPINMAGTIYTSRPFRNPLLEWTNVPDGYIKSSIDERDFEMSRMLSLGGDRPKILGPAS